jgi:hypothetical protein
VVEMDYIEETLKFIESEEVREHLCTAWSMRFNRNDCGEIVSRAPFSIEKKLPVLDLIAEQTEYYSEWPWHDPAILAKHARIALEGLYNIQPGTVFLLEEHHYGRKTFVRELFTTFEAVNKRIHELVDIEKSPNHQDYIWFYVEKWVPNEDGKMECPIYYYLNSMGEILYFDYTADFEPDDLFEANSFFDICGEIALPVPFKPGDIIIADCQPFAEIRKVLILENNINSGNCCETCCLHITKSDKINKSYLKHNSFLRPHELTYCSVVYRASVYDGKLAKTEAPLGVISAAIKKNPQLGYEIFEYLFDRSLAAYEDDSYDGVEWDHLKDKFGL